jgi:hypothetical protein
MPHRHYEAVFWIFNQHQLCLNNLILPDEKTVVQFGDGQLLPMFGKSGRSGFPFFAVQYDSYLDKSGCGRV